MGMHAAMAILISEVYSNPGLACMQCMPIFIYMHGYMYTASYSSKPYAEVATAFMHIYMYTVKCDVLCDTV